MKTRSKKKTHNTNTSRKNFYQHLINVIKQQHPVIQVTHGKGEDNNIYFTILEPNNFKYILSLDKVTFEVLSWSEDKREVREIIHQLNHYIELNKNKYLGD